MEIVLEDLLKPGLQVVFCGTGGVTASARARAYYPGPGNSFWRTLHATGLTPTQLAPSEYPRLLESGIGLTDVWKVRYASGAEEFDVDGLRARIAPADPVYLAFNGSHVAEGILKRDVEPGPQPERIGRATVWVLPSTAVTERSHWDIEPWLELARICTGTKEGAA